MKQGNFENEEFIRVGTTLYKLVNQPRLNGGYVKKRIVWNNETLRQDYGKDYLATVPKYDGFCTVPDHVDYRPVVDKFLNLYEPIGHRPQQGEFPCIRSLVRHIFGEQYELGMDYLQLLNRREDSERLKNLSTTLSYKVEAKGKDRDEIAFFAKFVLCSNNEYLPVIIDAGETRYWVRKIDRLQSDDTDFLQKLKAEIPAFLYYLQYRQLSTEKESRMWFAPSLLHTEALQKIIRSNRNRLEIEMCELILDIMESVGTDTFSFCHNDILLLLVHSQVKVKKHQVRKVLQECWKLTPASNGLTYTTYQFNYNRECRYEPIKRVGRFYTVTREQLESL